MTVESEVQPWPHFWELPELLKGSSGTGIREQQSEEEAAVAVEEAHPTQTVGQPPPTPQGAPPACQMQTSLRKVPGRQGPPSRETASHSTVKGSTGGTPCKQAGRKAVKSGKERAQFLPCKGEPEGAEAALSLAAGGVEVCAAQARPGQAGKASGNSRSLLPQMASGHPEEERLVVSWVQAQSAWRGSNRRRRKRGIWSRRQELEGKAVPPPLQEGGWASSVLLLHSPDRGTGTGALRSPDPMVPRLPLQPTHPPSPAGKVEAPCCSGEHLAHPTGVGWGKGQQLPPLSLPREGQPLPLPGPPPHLVAHRAQLSVHISSGFWPDGKAVPARPL
ncbi:uncharacterized protein LOC128326446 [Hemicordylus capensis]|uniref:uncharacterized protein LOC128326446 n=1 Tax=Hemicordylus capensis TaxID=884348 RepID=UPI002302D842|nr:uncharacterized protein LOC128326446 [Hemicordylus capensis]